MKSNYLKKKIKLNNLDKYAGKHFIDESSKLINTMRSEGKKALLGIQKSDNIYTVLSEKYVYYSALNGSKGKIDLSKFSDILHDNALNKGKFFFSYKYIIYNDDKIWLKNSSTMKSLWNTILWLEKPSNQEFIYK